MQNWIRQYYKQISYNSLRVEAINWITYGRKWQFYLNVRARSKCQLGWIIWSFEQTPRAIVGGLEDKVSLEIEYMLLHCLRHW